MIEIVEKFLDEYNLKKPEKTFLVGFSGGGDSLCLLNILHELSKLHGFRVIALHLNHNWRGDESLNDEANCRKFCKKNEIEYISEVLQDGPKTESFAREARYNFFVNHAEKYPDGCVFTAHTQTDNAETIIYRIIKGTGIKGLQGIKPERIVDGVSVYRPLLAVSTEQIQDYCSTNNLVPNIDSSNFNVNYKRNFIRHKIMPLFSEVNSNYEQSIISLAKVANEESKIVNEHLSSINADLFEGDKILTPCFKNLSKEVMRKIIYNLVTEKNLDYDYKKIDDILEFVTDNINSKSGSRYSLTNDLWLFVSSKYIYMITEIKAIKNFNEVKITSEGQWELPGTNYIFSLQKFSCDTPKVYPYENYLNNFCSGHAVFPAANEYLAYVRLDHIGLDLTLRTRKEGDFIIPFGMFGSMKLKKYLNSKGVAQHDKDNLILLCQASEVLWVAGVGLSNKLKVVNKPTHMIELLCK